MVQKILIGVGALILVLILAVLFSIQVVQREPQPLIVANFTELNKIEKISRYRSCVGHTTVPQDGREMRRNMKHYFWVKPEYNKSETVEIYAPYDGYVSVLRNEPGLNLEGEIWIRPKSKFVFLPPIEVWHFSVQHIDVRKDLKMGSEVRVGELIGYAALSEKRGNSFDIVYGKMSVIPKRIDNWTAPFTDLDSVFNHMSDQAFAKYQEKGIIKEDFIISKEQRDQNPCIYKDNGPYFQNQEDLGNWILLK